jgi:hypothetical protein
MPISLMADFSTEILPAKREGKIYSISWEK